MLCDSLIISRLAAELDPELIGARVGRVFTLGRMSAVLDLGRRSSRPQLLLSADPEFGRAALVGGLEPIPGEQTPFGDVLRRYLRGAQIVSVQQPRFDRMLAIEFSNAEGLGPDSRCLLMAEIMGKRGNLLLLDSDGVILECARQVPASQNRYRQSLPGMCYVPPPAGDRLTPALASAPALAARQEPNAKLGEWLRANVMGASGVFLQEIAARTGLELEQPLRRLPEDWAERLAEALESVRSEAVARGEPYVYNGPGELFAYPVVLHSAPDLACKPVKDMSAGLEEVHERLAGARDLEQRRQRVVAVGKGLFERADKRVREREAALRRAEDAERFRRTGELILANLRLIPPRAETVRVTDYFDETMPEVEIELNPGYPPQDVAQAYFARYKRAKRAAETIPALLEEARGQRDYAEDLLAQAERAEQVAELEALAEELVAQGLLRASRVRGTRGQRRELPRVQAGGYTVIYGRTGLQNDEVLRLASSGDIWLHVQRGPGGHVLIRTGGAPEKVPDAVIEAAASHAATLCKDSGQAYVEIVYTEARHVRKVKGAPPGFVLYDHFHSLLVPPRRLPDAGPGAVG